MLGHPTFLLRRLADQAQTRRHAQHGLELHQKQKGGDEGLHAETVRGGSSGDKHGSQSVQLVGMTTAFMLTAAAAMFVV
jgi:hypothetical protein